VGQPRVRPRKSLTGEMLVTQQQSMGLATTDGVCEGPPARELEGLAPRRALRRGYRFRPSFEAERLQKRLQRVLGFVGDSANVDFYISAVTEYNPFNTTDEILTWLRSLNEEQFFKVERIPLDQMEHWAFSRDTKDLQHVTRGFFSIRGLSVRANRGPIQSWSQPVIFQPEIGLLGIVTKKIDGILYFLMQAKAEPGNLNTFQLSPTVQATRSNFVRLHGGKPTAYLEYFLGDRRELILVDQLQSEQGARFYKKRNRNMIVRVADDDEIEIGPAFRWVTLGQLLRLIRLDNTVNMDARSVVSCISFDPEPKVSSLPVDGRELKTCLESSPLIEAPIEPLAIDLTLSAHSNSRPYHSLDQLICKLTSEKFHSELCAELIPLREVDRWDISPAEISHESGRYFSVIGVRVEAASREVSSWDQPILRQHSEGLVGFIVRPINDVLHFLVQLRVECGNMDILELAPTVQCITDSYAEGDLPPYAEYFTTPGKMGVVFDAMQSEEGGRFFQEANRNLIIQSGDELALNGNPAYVWMTLYQLKGFIKYNNYLNVEARSLLSCLSMV
jgi:oxidase EvaA